MLLRRLGSLLLSAIISLALCEAFVRAFVTVRDVGPSFSVYDPHFGKRLKANFHGVRRTPEFTMELTTNSLGQRGPEPVSKPEHPILFLGDSFTLGYGVNDGEEFPALISAELGRREGASAPPVVNAGIGDSGNGRWIKQLRDEGSRLAPRLVVFEVFANDTDDNLNERLFALEPSGELRELPIPEPSLQRRVQTAIESVPGLSQLHLVGMLRQLSPPSFGAAPASTPVSSAEAAAAAAPRAGLELTARLLDESAALCRKNGWPALAILVGLDPDVERAAREVYARYGFPVIDVPSKVERPDLYYVVDGHWNAKGHAYAASLLIDELTTH